MASYYSTNALYQHLEANPKSDFKFATGNMWQLVYGDNNCNPKVLVLAVGVPENDYSNPPSNVEKEAFEQLKFLSEECNLPLLYVRFVTDKNEIEGVKSLDKSGNYIDLSMQELTKQFSDFGLPTSNTSTAKYLNDKTSSAFHNWQRNSLGRALTVSDIDLWKLDEGNKPLCFYELKRSFISLNKWAPYPDDYRNFRLLSNLANSAKLGFRIAYNVRQTNPFNDDISNIKIFDVDFSKQTPISQKGIFSLNDFFVQ